MTKRPLVVVIHGSGVDYYKHCFTLPTMYRSLKWAVSIIVQKTSAIRILMKWGIPKEKIFYVEEAVNTDVRRIYQMRGIFVALSPYNNFSDLAMLKAMSCGLPVLATNSGETYKTIKDGWNGLLIEPKNVEQLKEKVLLIFNNPSLAKQLGENARKTVLENYSLDKFGGETLKIL